MERARCMLVADLGVAHVALKAGVRCKRAVDELALRVDLGLGVIGVLGESLDKDGGEAAVLDVAEDGAERPGRPQLCGDGGEGARYRAFDGLDGPLERVIQVVEDWLLGGSGRACEQKRAGQDAGGGEEKWGFEHWGNPQKRPSREVMV